MNDPKLTYSKKISGVSILELDSCNDDRGLNLEIDNKLNKEIKWQLRSLSISNKNSLRGFHGDAVGYKLIQPAFGEIQFVLYDDRKSSPTYGNLEEFILNAKIPKQIIFGPGVLNAHLALTDCSFYYQWEYGYIKIENQLHIKWNDKRILKQITWKCKNPILSERDK